MGWKGEPRGGWEWFVIGFAPEDVHAGHLLAGSRECDEKDRRSVPLGVGVLARAGAEA